MFRPLLLAAGFALFAPAASAKTIVVTQTQNGRAVTMIAGDTLVVRLVSSHGGLEATEWSVVYDPKGMLRLSSDPHYLFPMNSHGGIVIGNGGPITEEFRFTVQQSKESFIKGGWLRFLALSDFDPDVRNARFWKIKYTIKASH